MRHFVDDVWCNTCSHVHIYNIPATTFSCSDCGFGSWSTETAESHAREYLSHIVYPKQHSTVPVAVTKEYVNHLPKTDYCPIGSFNLHTYNYERTECIWCGSNQLFTKDGKWLASARRSAWSVKGEEGGV